MFVVGEEVRLDLRLDLEGVGFESLGEEAEIRCGQRGRRVAEVSGGEEITDVDGVEEGLHCGRDGIVEAEVWGGLAEMDGLPVLCVGVGRLYCGLSTGEMTLGLIS